MFCRLRSVPNSHGDVTKDSCSENWWGFREEAYQHSVRPTVCSLCVHHRRRLVNQNKEFYGHYSSLGEVPLPFYYTIYVNVFIACVISCSSFLLYHSKCTAWSLVSWKTFTQLLSRLLRLFDYKLVIQENLNYTIYFCPNAFQIYFQSPPCLKGLFCDIPS